MWCCKWKYKKALLSFYTPCWQSQDFQHQSLLPCVQNSLISTHVQGCTGVHLYEFNHTTCISSQWYYGHPALVCVQNKTFATLAKTRQFYLSSGELAWWKSKYFSYYSCFFVFYFCLIFQCYNWVILASAVFSWFHVERNMLFFKKSSNLCLQPAMTYCFLNS